MRDGGVFVLLCVHTVPPLLSVFNSYSRKGGYPYPNTSISSNHWDMANLFSFTEMVGTMENRNLIASFCQHKMRTWPCPEKHRPAIFFITSVQWWSNQNLKVINWISFSQPKPYSNTQFYQGSSKEAINWGILKNWNLIQSMIWSGFSGNNKLGLLKLGSIPTFYVAHTTGPSKFYCKRQGYSVRSKTMLN